MYAMAEFGTLEEMLEDQGFQQVGLRWSFFQMSEDDEGHILGTVLPVAHETVKTVTLAFEREADELLSPYNKSKPRLYKGIRRLARMAATKHISEHLCHELLGRNSFGERKPHSHIYCAASILEAGRVQSFPRDFEEGMGYKPR